GNGSMVKRLHRNSALVSATKELGMMSLILQNHQLELQRAVMRLSAHVQDDGVVAGEDFVSNVVPLVPSGPEGLEPDGSARDSALLPIEDSGDFILQRDLLMNGDEEGFFNFKGNNNSS